MSGRSPTAFVKSTVEKIKKFLDSKWGEFAVLTALSALGLLFTVIFYSVRFTDFYFEETNRGDL